MYSHRKYTHCMCIIIYTMCVASLYVSFPLVYVTNVLKHVYWITKFHSRFVSHSKACKGCTMASGEGSTTYPMQI